MEKGNSSIAKNEEATLVFCMYIVRNGKRIYRKNGRPFCFRVKQYFLNVLWLMRWEASAFFLFYGVEGDGGFDYGQGSDAGERDVLWLEV